MGELDASAQGTGFAFIVMAEVFTKIPGAPLWSGLFFMMLLTLGLGSQIGIMEGVVSTLFDQPGLQKVGGSAGHSFYCSACRWGSRRWWAAWPWSAV